MMSRFLIIVIAGLAMACMNIPVYNVLGTWENGDGEYVYIQRKLEDKRIETIDSAKVENGRFHMSKPFDGIEEVMFKAGKVSTPFLLEEGPVFITCKMFETEYKEKMVQRLQIEISGSPEQEIYSQFIDVQKNEMLLLFGLSLLVQSEDASQEMIDSMSNNYVRTQTRNRIVFDSLVSNNPDRVASAIIINDQSKNLGLEKTENAFNKLTPNVRESVFGKKLKGAIDLMKSVTSGAPAPDFTLPSPDGNEIKLSDFRGKYLLLDFWASWCGPCLREVPNVKKVYDAYHDKGFEILGVSLDEDAEAWKNAIRSNHLNWNHVSSLEGWGCPVAKKYSVSAVPTMILIDPAGNIIDGKLRGEALEKKISDIFGSAN